MKTIILNFTGNRDFSDNLMYKDDEGYYFSKDKYTKEIIYIGSDPDGDPWGSVGVGAKNWGIDRYKDVEFITAGDENLPTEAERFNYMMLDRLRTDCNYYLGNGGRHEKHLWAGNVKGQIKEMKNIYNSFTDDKKPEWLTWDQILEYEEQMQ